MHFVVIEPPGARLPAVRGNAAQGIHSLRVPRRSLITSAFTCQRAAAVTRQRATRGRAG